MTSATDPDHVSTTTSESTREDNREANKPAVSNGLPETPPTLNAEPVVIRRKVEALKQQFLIPQQPPVATTNSPSPPLDDVQPSRGKVKDLIAQIGDSERVLTPPPSPLLEEDLSMIRNSRIISNAITHLTQQNREGGSEGRRSYTPPNVRRRINSPFLDQEGKEEGSKDEQTSQEVSPDVKRREEIARCQSPNKCPVPIPGDEEGKVRHIPEKRSLSLIPMVQKDLSPIPEKLSPSMSPGVIPPGIVPRRSQSPIPMEFGRSRSPVLHVTFPDAEPSTPPLEEGTQGGQRADYQAGTQVVSVPDKGEVAAGVLKVDQNKIDVILRADAASRKEDVTTPPPDAAVVPAIPPRSSSLYSQREGSTAGIEEGEEAAYSGTLPILLDNGKKKTADDDEDDHLVALVFPRKQSRQSTSSYQSSGSSYQSSGRNYQSSSHYQSRSGSLGHGGHYQSRSGSLGHGGQQGKKPSVPQLQKKLSNPASLDDVFINFESGEKKGGIGGLWDTIGRELASRGEVTVQGPGEELVRSPEHLPESRGQYDHLPPLPSPPDHDQGYYRNRSSSDVISHRTSHSRKAKESKVTEVS
jgi:hypothetical protein